MLVRAAFLALLGATATAGCSSSETTAGTPDTPPSSTGFGTTKDAGTQSSALECSDAARLVYVVSRENDLYSFAPNKVTFKRIGRLACPDTVGEPNSMAIDHSGVAWVNYTDGALFRVSTTDASCTATKFVPEQQGIKKFAMAFTTDPKSPAGETLYVSGLDYTGARGLGLGKIDLATMKLTTLGDYPGDLAGRGAELTGTGDGRLFGFFVTSPATLAQIGTSDVATSKETPLDGVSTGRSYAFSFWGGDFWFYTSPSAGVASKVTRLAASAKNALTVVKEDVGGFEISGAGVSTCAPTEPPR